jgi:hypothetical protein
MEYYEIYPSENISGGFVGSISPDEIERIINGLSIDGEYDHKSAYGGYDAHGGYDAYGGYDAHGGYDTPNLEESESESDSDIMGGIKDPEDREISIIGDVDVDEYQGGIIEDNAISLMNGGYGDLPDDGKTTDDGKTSDNDDDDDIIIVGRVDDVDGGYDDDLIDAINDTMPAKKVDSKKTNNDNDDDDDDDDDDLIITNKKSGGSNVLQIIVNLIPSIFPKSYA